jgi:hypothetical protein
MIIVAYYIISTTYHKSLKHKQHNYTAMHHYNSTTTQQHNNTTTQQHNNTTTQQYTNTTIQKYINATIHMHNNTTKQQYNITLMILFRENRQNLHVFNLWPVKYHTKKNSCANPTPGMLAVKIYVSPNIRNLPVLEMALPFPVMVPLLEMENPISSTV